MNNPVLLPVAALLMLVPSALSAELITTSGTGAAAVSGGGNSSAPLLSADARWLLFLSHANNLVTNDDRGEWLDVFARDLISSNTLLVSVAASGTGGGNGNSAYASLSTNGPCVVFSSEADNLVAGDTNRSSDIFLRDLVAGATRMLSVSPNGTPGRGASEKPRLSADGRWVAFESAATNLVANADPASAGNVLRLDLATGRIDLVNAPVRAADAAAVRSWNPVISRNGRFAAFLSTSLSLAGAITDSKGDVYVRDMVTGTNHWASAGLAAVASNYRCRDLALSEDGRVVVFTAAVAAVPWLCWYDLESGAFQIVNTAVADQPPQISADGRHVVFESSGAIYRWDATTTNAGLVSVRDGDPGGALRNPVITPDANGIAFTSDSPLLATNNPDRVFQLYLRDMAAGVTRLISSGPDGAPSRESSETAQVTVANDLSIVAFSTTASDLVAGDGNRASDVFVRDPLSNGIELISRRDPALPRASGRGNTYVTFGGVSSNASVVAFTSFDSDLVPNDTNGWSDVFVRDVTAGATRAAGIASDGSMLPVLSLNGRYVAYIRGEPSIVSIYQPEVRRLDVQTGMDLMVASNPRITGNGGAFSRPAISPDGRSIAYLGPSPFTPSIVLTNLDDGTGQTLVYWPSGSQSPQGITGVPVRIGTDDRHAEFTPDGRHVVHASATALYAFDQLAFTNHFVTNLAGIARAAVSGNSRFLAVHRGGSSAETRPVVVYDFGERTLQSFDLGMVRFLSLDYAGRYLVADIAAAPSYLVLCDRETGETNVVAMPAGSVPSVPQLGGNGRFLVFASAATGDFGEHSTGADLFVRDLLRGVTTRVAVALNGASGNAPASRPILAADGRTVVFQSFASDLAPSDYNDKRDLFMLALGSPDEDGDDMDDDWEVAHFGNLERTGIGDFDGDGVSDAEEFRAGTDPTNGDSVFRVFTISHIAAGVHRLVWHAVPDRQYRVEYKDDFAAAWSLLETPVFRSGTTAWAADSAPSMRRFYRVVRLP